MSEESAFLRHIPCPSCGSSDANSLYSDGHEHCHKCGHHTGPKGEVTESTQPKRRMAGNLIQNLTYQHLERRRLNEATCQKWEYGIGEYKGQRVQVAQYRTPDGSRIVAQKVRTANKEFVFLGEVNEAGLYGQWLWKDGGKRVVVTEGEIDALSVSQVQDNRWPVVSIPTGAKGAKKTLSAQLQWLEKFEEIVLLFDNDEPGREAAKDCADLFTPGKCKIGVLPLKDASDMLQAGRAKEIVDAIWQAKAHRPDGIVAGTELWDRILNYSVGDAPSYPWSGLNDLTRGFHKPEILLIGAGTGVGKSEFARSILHHFLTVHGETCGAVALEETVERTSLGMMGLTLGKRIHIDRSNVSEKELRASFDKTVGSGKFYLYDHWGSTDSDNLINKLKYMVRGLGCTTLLLDHISIVVSGIEDGDERRIIDNTMTRLRSVVQETGCRLIVVAHLKAIEGKPHEEGARVTLGHFRGSKSLTQLSDTIIGLERDQQDEEKKLFTHVRLLKNRLIGDTGSAGWIKFDTESGVLSEADPAFAENGDEGESDF